MMNQTFEIIVTNALRTATPSSGDNLLGFDIDLCYALDHSNCFSQIKAKRTGDQRNMLAVTCRLKPKYENSIQIEQMLISLWKEQISYNYFEAHDSHRDEQYVILRYVTLSGNTSTDLCVTGTIIVSGIGKS